MLWKTHVLGGLIAGALLIPLTTEATPTLVAISGASALLPDIDTSSSKLGRAFYPISRLLESVLGHRCFLHSLGAVAALFILLQIFFPSLAVPVAAGYLSHIVLDVFNPQGVPLFYPLKSRFSIPLTQTGGIGERIIFFPLIALCGVLLFRIPLL